MEYFLSVLCSFFLLTLFFWHQSLLDSKGWFAVFVSFCSLIIVQRSHVRHEKEREMAAIEKTIQDFLKLQREKHELEGKNISSAPKENAAR